MSSIYTWFVSVERGVRFFRPALTLPPRRYTVPHRLSGPYAALYSICPVMYTARTATQGYEYREGKATALRQGEGSPKCLCYRTDESGVVSSCNTWSLKRSALCREIDVKEVDMTSVSPHSFNDLAIQFVGELCQCTRVAPTEEAHREALQAFCNTLFPWIDPAEVPHPPHALCTLVKEYHI